MREFAKAEGFFFYVDGSLDEQRLMRMRRHAGCVNFDADNYVEFSSSECRLASRGSFLYKHYTSPDYDEVARFKSKEERGEWKADILQVCGINRLENTSPRRPGSPRKSPHRRVLSCDSLSKREV